VASRICRRYAAAYGRAHWRQVEFKILVSYDFHFDWYVYFQSGWQFVLELLYFRHEHLYEKIERNLIRSDGFNDIVTMERLLLGSRVLFCTISMLSNMKMSDFSRLVPLQTVIFDEASQIEIGDYFPMLVHFRSTLLY